MTRHCWTFALNLNQTNSSMSTSSWNSFYISWSLFRFGKNFGCCIICPLNFIFWISFISSHLYRLLGQEALAAGSVQQLLAGIRVAREIHPTSLGLKEGQPAPPMEILERATASMERLQRAASPLDKLEQLLDACTVIYNHAAETCGESVAAEDFLPLLALLLAHCGFSTAEMEADFMWALLQPSLLAGEGGYFLTALSSAAQLLKNLQSRPASPSDCGSWMGTLTSIPGGDGVSSCASISTIPQQPCVLRVLVADENQSSLLARTVPLRPSMTVRDVTKLLALKLRLSNPQDFTLVALVDGQGAFFSPSP